jgi:hypothetical protein
VDYLMALHRHRVTQATRQRAVDFNAAMELIWHRIAINGPPGRPIQETPLGDFIRRQLSALVFSVLEQPAFSRQHLDAVCTVATEMGIYEEYRTWMMHSLAAHAERLAIPLLDSRYPALAQVIQTVQQHPSPQFAPAPPAPHTPVRCGGEHPRLETILEAPALEIYTAQEQEEEEEDEPAELYFMDFPDSESEESEEEDTAKEDTDEGSESDNDEPPSLLSSSEDYDSEDDECSPAVCEIYAQARAAPRRQTHVPNAVDPSQVPTGLPEAHPARTYMEPQELPDDETCDFPDDDALGDHTHTTLAALVDQNNLSTEEQEKLVSLLEENREVFCFHPSQLGTCTVGSGHIIDTGDATPIKQTYYKMPYKKQQELETHVQKWRELGIIRPSSSPWSSPMHLVPKKGGETRAVIDYRKLNTATRKDAFPLPRIDDILYNLGSAQYFSVVDLFSGYLQIAMAGLEGPDPHDSIAKTAFCCQSGLYEFTKMPFGLTNAPSAFMRTITQVLKPFIGKFLFVFMDDVIIFSTDFESHCRQLQLVFQALREANLKLSSTKCSFATSHCTFLGFSVSAAGLGCDSRLIEAIALRTEPYKARNPKKAVMSFLGLCGFYRRFVKGYAAIAEPLTRLTGKNQPFVWGPEQQHAFDTLKAKLMAYPLLRRPDFEKPFIVHTDASLKAVGAVLTQRDEEGREYAVAYHSSKLSPTQRNWAVTHLECYAVVNAVCDAFKNILLGNEFSIVSDHTALKWLMTSPNLQGKLARWSLRLQEFLPFTIEYRKGTQHLAADAMSRDPRHENNPKEDALVEHIPLLEIYDPDLDSLLTMEDPSSTTPSNQVDPPAAAPQHEDLTTSASESDLETGTEASSETCTPIRISIEGNIGCGKSTVLAGLQELQTQPYWEQWQMMPEPVSDWSALLGPFYSGTPGSTHRHAAATVLQVGVLNSYALRTPDPVVAPMVIMERSPWSSLAVFLPVQRLPPPMENVVSQAAHHMHASLDNALPTALIYLRMEPEVCLARAQRRQRPGEAGVTLEYLQTLHQQYDQAVTRFPGAKVVIQGHGSRAAVLNAVKAAIELLHAQHDRTRPPPAGRLVPHPTATTPFAVHECAILQRLCPGQLLTTMDPYYLRLFPDQLLTLRDNDSVADNPDTHPQGTPEDSPTTSGPPTEKTSTPDKTPTALFDYLPTAPHLLYDRVTEVPVLFQAGPGIFKYSPVFEAEHQRRFGRPVTTLDRVDNHDAVELYAALRPWVANAPQSQIALAVVPRKALPALQVWQVHSNGTESVFVDPTVYALVKVDERRNTYPYHSQDPEGDTPFSWENGFRNEAYTMDSWIRQVRLRPVIPCGVTLHNPVPTTLVHGTVTPLTQEHSSDLDTLAVRLASCLPYAEETAPPSPTSDQVNMLDQHSRPPKRKSARNALKRMHNWTHAQRQEVTEHDDIPEDLPCQICGSPYDESLMILCDRCDRGYHTYCMELKSIPDGSWICPSCARPRSRVAPTLSSHSSSPMLDSPSDWKGDASNSDPMDPPSRSTAAAAAAAGTSRHAVLDLRNPLKEDSEGGSQHTEDSKGPPGPILEIWEDAAVMQYLQTQQ